MKIGGPKGPSKPPNLDKPQDKPATSKTGPSFDRALGGAGAADKAAATASPAAAGSAAELDALVGRVRSGEITGRQAAEQMVERVVAARPGLSPAMQQKLREALLSQLEDDPTLLASMRAMET